jgi:hypothetical protein
LAPRVPPDTLDGLSRSPLLAEPAPEPSIIRSTLRALLHPRRLVPVLLVSATLVAAQRNYSRDPLAIPLAILMCLTFVVVAPVSWRVLFPDRIDLRHGGIRLILYGAIGAGVVLSIGVVVPRALGMGHTFLTAPSSVVVSLALFLVGGLGLGRDIWLEHRWLRAEARAQAHARDAERAQLLALRSHLDPHFLFNTLNAIAEWCRARGHAAVGDAAHGAGRRTRRELAAGRRDRAVRDIAVAAPLARSEPGARGVAVAGAAPARRGPAHAAAAARRERRQARAGRGP